MKGAFKKLKWPVWPAYRWQDNSDKDGKPFFVEPAHRFETPAAVENAWRLNDKKQRKTGPVLDFALDSGSPHMISPMAREHATLFLTFSQIAYADRDEVLGFAMTYGLLGLEWESHINWAREVCQMKEALALADREDRTPEDDRKLAWLFNSRLQDVVGRFEVASKMRLTYGPRTLRASMWFQFSLGLAGGYEYRKCKHCERLFEISTEDTGFRSHRAFCTDTCKTKNYQQRKKTALRLSASGTRLSAIAKQADTKIATVRRWVKEAKHKSSGGR